MSAPVNAPEPATPFDYGTWSRLLARVVTPDGKVDYEALAARRDLLDDFVALLASASPDTAPRRFPSEDHALAYWINAYNAFVLHAVMEEYPIRSVWKVKDGQFFDRRRHDAGGRVVSLNDIEHRILRARFAEPRIHFAINCASNGCPPMRPQAYEAGGLRDTLDAATRQFLASEWNCRVDAERRRISVSRLFRMYAEDFAGDVDSTEAYRQGVLAFVAQHTGVSPVELGEYEVVYNVYDWGLNDAHRAPNLRPITFHESVETFHEGDAELRELYPLRRQFLQSRLLLVHGVRLARRLAPGVFRAGARLGGGGHRPGRAISSSTEASPRSTSRGSSRPCATCGAAASGDSSRSTRTACAPGR